MRAGGRICRSCPGVYALLYRVRQAAQAVSGVGFDVWVTSCRLRVAVSGTWGVGGGVTATGVLVLLKPPQQSNMGDFSSLAQERRREVIQAIIQL